MDFIELESPTRRPNLLERDDFHYRITDVTYLPPPAEQEGVNLYEIINKRRTRREFGTLSVELLSSLLWHCMKSRQSHRIDDCHTWHHKPVPSGGGRHPIDQLIFRANDHSYDVLIYDHVAHALGQLTVSKELVTEFIGSVNDIVGINEATIIWNVAQTNKVTSVYHHATSLVYRDEGAIQATCGLVAEALNLNFCTLGVSGEPYISRLIDPTKNVIGIGGMLVGSRPEIF